MRRKEAAHVHRRRHISNRHLSDKYYYAGEHETVTDIRLTQYNAEALHTTEVKKGTSSFGKLVDPSKINWFQVSGLTDSDTITRIVKEFGLHNLDAKDILTPQHVVKIEEYANHVLIILNSSYYDANMEIHSEHISLLVTGNVVITFTESNNPVFANTMKALESDMLNLRKKRQRTAACFPAEYDHCQSGGNGLQSRRNAGRYRRDTARHQKRPGKHGFDDPATPA